MKRPNKLAICVTFHYVAERLRYLSAIASQFPTLADEVHLTVVTNAGTDAERHSVLQSVPTQGLRADLFLPIGIGHPYLLPWSHFSVFRRLANDETYSHFLYVEDDLEVTEKNVKYWVAAREMLRSVRLIPSFLRIEYRDDDLSTPRSTDCKRQVRFAECSQVKATDNLVFLNLPFPYQGMYLLDRELMIEHLSGQSSNPDFGPWHIREKAAQGLTFASPPRGFRSRNVVPYLLHERSIDASCFVRHLPGNYANSADPSNLFGRIPVASLIVHE